MPRPRLIQDEQLLQAAREVFLEQGFSAPTSTIAQRAGVSEGTLFKRFATKEDLFVAALGLGSYGTWRGELLAQIGQGSVQRNLEQAALSLLRESDAWMRNMMAVFSRGIDPGHNPLLERLGDTTQADILVLGEYLRAETELGRVRPHDSEVTALALLGALGSYMQCSAFSPPGSPISAPSLALPDFRPQVFHIPKPGRFVRGVMDVLWPGLCP